VEEISAKKNIQCAFGEDEPADVFGGVYSIWEGQRGKEYPV